LNCGDKVTCLFVLAATSLAAVVAIAVLLSAVIVTGGLFVLGWYVFSQQFAYE